MKHQFTLIASLAAAASSYGAAVMADRMVVTNSVPNNGPNVATHWAEVQAFQQGSGTNVAAGLNGGTATASSVGWGTSVNGPINGDTSGGFSEANFWHDNDGQGGGAEPDVYTVVFSGAVQVDSFNIWGRTDCCDNRDDTFLVEFFNGATLVGSNATGIPAGFSNTGITPINAVIPEPAVSAVGLLALGALSLRRRRA